MGDRRHNNQSGLSANGSVGLGVLTEDSEPLSCDGNLMHDGLEGGGDDIPDRVRDCSHLRGDGWDAGRCSRTL